MNVVVVRGLGQGMGAPLRRDSYVMKMDRERNCYACGVLGTWPIIVETGEEEEQWKKEEENMEGKGSRKISKKLDI